MQLAPFATELLDLRGGRVDLMELGDDVRPFAALVRGAGRLEQGAAHGIEGVRVQPSVFVSLLRRSRFHTRERRSA